MAKSGPFSLRIRENLAFQGLDGVDGVVGESEIPAVLHDHPNADVGLLSGRDGAKSLSDFVRLQPFDSLRSLRALASAREGGPFGELRAGCHEGGPERGRIEWRARLCRRKFLVVVPSLGRQPVLLQAVVGLVWDGELDAFLRCQCKKHFLQLSGDLLLPKA